MTEDINFTNPDDVFLRSIDVHTLLPQQEPFVMISRIIHFDNVRTVTETDIKVNNIFVDDNTFSASGLIENIAQTCACRIGYANKYIFKKGIQIGFIGAIKNLNIIALPHTGSMITTTVDVKEEIFGMTLAEAFIECDGKKLVTTEIKIAIKDNGTESK
nr:pseudouridylate synthase [Prevotella sp.]